MTELRLIWTYIRAVFGHWWVITIEGVLVLTDFIERILGTWLVPPLWVKGTTGVAVLMVAQYMAYRAEVKEKGRIFENRPSPGGELNSFVETAHGETHCRMESYNPPASEPAHNVEVKLIQIEPLPRSEYFRARADFPYIVRLAHLADGIVDTSAAHDINPGTSRQFELLYYWESSDHRLMVNGVDTKQGFRDARFSVEENECWQMTYEVSSAQTGIQRPVFRMRREGMSLLMSRLS